MLTGNERRVRKPGGSRRLVETECACGDRRYVDAADWRRGVVGRCKACALVVLWASDRRFTRDSLGRYASRPVAA